MPGSNGQYCECGGVLAEFASVCPVCSKRHDGAYPAVLYQSAQAAALEEGVRTEQQPLRSTIRSIAVQTRGTFSEETCKSPSPTDKLAPWTGQSKAAQALGLAVGVLGLEVHEKTSSWAEAWLAFQDQPASPSRHGLADAASKPDKREWQGRVLGRLREALAKSGGATRRRNGSGAGEGDDGLGPNYEEHLDVAEFVLARIAHAVAVLEDPGKSDCTVVLREYTDQMVIQVCQDLRQWLEQLASLLSLYHVHILDVEAECRRLDEDLQSERQCRLNGEDERVTAVRKYDVLQQQWKEDKMKRRAEALLGISIECKEDALIYSQNDVDRMLLEWEKENLEPLMAEVNELKRAQDLLSMRLKDKNEEVSHLKKANNHNSATTEVLESGLSSSSVSALVAVLQGLAERTVDSSMSDMLLRVGRSVKDGGYTLPTVLQEISQMPIPSVPSSPSRRPSCGGASSDAVVRRLSLVIDEMETLESALKKCPSSTGADKLVPLITWSRQELDGTRLECHTQGDEPEGVAARPPVWGLGALAERGGTTAKSPAAGVGHAVASSLTSNTKPEMEAEMNRRMDAFREKLQAQLLAAQTQAAAEKVEMETAMEALRAQLEASEKRSAKLRERLLHLEKLLKAKGLGEELADAMRHSGLAEYLAASPSVFQRLYNDALDRMRRCAEREMLRWQETSDAAEAIFRGSPEGAAPPSLMTAMGLQGSGTTPENSPKSRAGGDGRGDQRDGEGSPVSGSLSWRAQTSPDTGRGPGGPMVPDRAEQRRVLAAANAAKVRPKWNFRGDSVDLSIGKPAQPALGRPPGQRVGSKEGRLGSKSGEQGSRGALPPIMRRLSEGHAELKGSPRSDKGLVLLIERIGGHGGGPGDSPELSDPSSSRTEPHPEPRPERTAQSPAAAGKVSTSGHPRATARLPRLSRSLGSVSTPLLGRHPSRQLMQDVGAVG